jgi:hypothetical protein
MSSRKQVGEAFTYASRRQRFGLGHDAQLCTHGVARGMDAMARRSSADCYDALHCARNTLPARDADV